MVALQARPLRFDATRLVVPLALLPGLAMAAAHVPVALFTIGPLVLSSWVLARRDRFRLDRCAVHLDGPALELRYDRRRLDALDLRYAARQETSRGDLVLYEGDSSFLAFGTDPPDNAYMKGDRDGDAQGLWRAVRLSPPDLALLFTAVSAVAPCAPPDAEEPSSLLDALGSVGVWGRQAEALLEKTVAEEQAGGRPAGLLLALHERALRPDLIGAAARRVLRRGQRG